MLDQRLQQKLQQKLSPQQIQLIKLLEIPVMALEQRIKKEIEENPALEELSEDYEVGQEETGYDSEFDDTEDNVTNGDEIESDFTDEFDLEDLMPADDDVPLYRLTTNNYSQDDMQREIPYSGGTTFHEYLVDQLGLKRDVDDDSRYIAEYIIGNIDDDGYLRRKLSSIADDLVFTQNIRISEAELEKVLKIVQELEPPGVGARDLQECLILQIERLDQTQEEVQLASKILRSYFNEFTRKHYQKIMQRLELTEEKLKEVLDIILHLNPKPGSAFNDPMQRDVNTIIPDFVVENNNGELTITLNSRNVPELRINPSYIDMLEEYSAKRKNKNPNDRDTLIFVKQKIDSAKWFIDAIKQRQDTLLVTMEAIVNYQKEYFLTGDERKIRPMILKDIADITGLDISTISRVANSKYVQTEFGILSLKSFFSESMATESGEEVSTREIKNILQECIDNEDKRKPLTDEKLTEILCEKGYNIARRTVAKYREQLNIPVARLRKQI